jgi:predicted secreted protein
VAARDRRLTPARLLAVVVAATLIASCGDGDGDEPRVLTGDQSGSEIELDAGERFEIHLESNPSTGFAWEISAMSTPELVTLDDRRYVEPGADLVGATGTEIFVFTAGTEAAGLLRLEYVRDFEEPRIPERVAEFVIRIGGADWRPAAGTAPSVNTAVAPDSDG